VDGLGHGDYSQVTCFVPDLCVMAASANDGEDVLARDLSRIGLKWTPVLLLEDPLAAPR
jgi:hypothetical protein